MKNWFPLFVMIGLVACQSSPKISPYEAFLDRFPNVEAPTHISDPASLGGKYVLSDQDRQFLIIDNIAYPDSLVPQAKWKSASGNYFFQMASPGAKGIEVSLYAQDSIGGGLHKEMELAYSHCQSGSCHQQDAWLEDVNSDGLSDIILKYVRSSEQGIIKQEGIVPFFQGEDGILVPSGNQKPDSRRFVMAEVGIHRFDFRADQLLKVIGLDSLEKVYGSYLSTGSYIFPGEMTPQEVSVLFANTNNELTVDWGDDDEVVRIAFGSAGGQWYLSEGLIDDATSLKELVEINQAPVSFYGFDWKYGGKITSWNDGKLAKKGLSIYLEMRDRKAPPNELKGDIILKSSDLDDRLQIEVLSIVLSNS